MKRCVNLIRASGATLAARNATNKVSDTHAQQPQSRATASARRSFGFRSSRRSSLLTRVFPVIAPVCPQSSVRTFAAFADFNWKDPLNLDSKLTDEERMVRDTAHTYAQSKLLPRITQANRSDERNTPDITWIIAERQAGCGCANSRAPLRLVLSRVTSLILSARCFCIVLVMVTSTRRSCARWASLAFSARRSRTTAARACRPRRTV